jgi:hypothetical protein
MKMTGLATVWAQARRSLSSCSMSAEVAGREISGNLVLSESQRIEEGGRRALVARMSCQPLASLTVHSRKWDVPA